MISAGPARFWMRYSIRTQFAILVLIVIAAFLGATAASVYKQETLHGDAALENALEAARVVSSRVDAHFADMDLLLRAVAVAVMPDLGAIEANDAKLRQLQSGLPPYFSSISVLAPDGRMLNSSTASPGERAKLNFADRKYFIDAIASRGLAFDEPIQSRTSGEWIVILARPIVADDGQIRGVVSMSTLLRRFQELLVRGGLPPGSLVTLLDERGVVIARSSDVQHWFGRDLSASANFQRALREHEFSAEVVEPDGIRQFSGYAMARHRPWIAHVAIPSAAAMAPAHYDIRNHLLISGVVLTLALGLVLWLIRSITVPVRRIEATAAQIAAGSLEARAEPGGPREIAAVALQINAMLDAQQAAQSELRERHEALRAKERHLSTIHDNAHEIIINLGVEPNGQFRFTSVNRRFTEATGLPADQVVGKLVQEVIPEPSCARALAKYKEAIREKQPAHWEEVSDYPAGKKVAEVTVAPVFDASGNCTQLIGTVHDITARKQAQEALRESEEFYRRTLDNMLEGCQIIGFDWRYRYVNDAAARDGRKPKGALLGHTMMEVYPGIETSDLYAVLQRCMAERSSHQLENEFVFADGARGWFQLSVRPVPEGIFILSVDVTDRKRAEKDLRGHARRLEALRELDLVILEAHTSREIVGAGLMHLGRLVPCWAAAVVLFDLEANEAVLLEGALPPGIGYETGSRLPLEQYGLDGLTVLKDGQARIVFDVATMSNRSPLVEALREKGLRSFAGIPLCVEGALIGALNLGSGETGYFTDERVKTASAIADRLAIGLHQAILREKIVRHAAELESRVTERTAELSAANAQLELANAAAESANRAKSAFLAMMSHEIRTPMNAISGMLELLALSRLNDEQAKMLDVVSVSAQSLLSIVNDVLDFSKIEAGRLEIHPEPVSVKAVLTAIEQLFLGSASQKGLLLRCRIADAVPSMVRCDALRLKQIISNLVSNAIKFTVRGEVEIGVNATRHEADQVLLKIAVRDSGIGISAEDQAKLFQPFVQIQMDSSRQFAGTGLGLAICRRLADLMGGALSLESALGKGTTVTLAIPVAVVDATHSPVTSAVLAPAANMGDRTDESWRVLVCDDNALNRDVAGRQLRALGYAVDTAEDGLDAMRKWETGNYSFILLDCQMPHMSGYQVAQRVREAEKRNPQRGRTVILAYTANVIQEDRERCFAAGMDDVITKPASLQTLRHTLGASLRKRAGSRISAIAMGKKYESVVGQAPGGGESPIDWTRLKEISGADGQLERDILLGFIAEKEADVRQIAELIPAGPMTEVARLAHRVKSAARTAAAEDLGALCEELETLARRGERATAVALRERFEQAFGAVKSYVERRYG